MSLLLVIDIGNTNTKVGVCDTSRVLASWALTTRRDQTADEYGLMIERLLASRGITPDAIAGIAISNVVPPVQRALDDMAPRFFGVQAISVEPGPDAPIALDVDDPHAVGADRIVAALAAQVRYGTPVIVVDLGTATRFDCVNRAGAFVGGAIAPGIGIAFDALVQRAARLSRVPLDRPSRAIGRDTATSLQSGVVYGYAGLVDGVVERMKRELDGVPVVVATGGLAPLLEGVARSIDHVDADLKLDGLRMAHARTATIEPRIR